MMGGTYQIKLSCYNCGHEWVGTFEKGTKVWGTWESCPNCEVRGDVQKHGQPYPPGDYKSGT